MKKIKRLLTILASASIAFTSASASITYADVHYDGNWVCADGYSCDIIPDWVPKNYLDALEFSNKYGVTHTDSKFMCIVQQRNDNVSEEGYYDISLTVDGSSVSDSYRPFYADIHFSKDDIPDESDTEAYAAFKDRLEAVGCDIQHLGDDNYFRVEVYTTLYQTIDVEVKEGADSYVYSFKRTGLEGEQLDVFRFLPDSVEEYDEFIEKHGNLCAYEDYIVYCGDVQRMAGCKLEMKQSGTASIKEMLGYCVEKRLPSSAYLTDGGTSRVVKLYKVISTGNIDVDMTVATPQHTADKTISKNFTIEEYNTLYRKYRITENRNELPEWVPSDFASASEFECEHGATFIKDGYICCVRRMQANGEGYHSIISSSIKRNAEDINDPDSYYNKPYSSFRDSRMEYDCRVSSRLYGLGIPEKPDKNEREAYKAYLAALEKYGLSENNADEAMTDLCYSVDVFKPEAASFLEVKWDYSNVNTEEEIGTFCRLDFETDQDGNITETDLFGWLPDCVAEAEEFSKKNGVVSVQNGYIVFCLASHGHYLETVQDGVPEVKNIFKYYFSDPYIIPRDGDKYAQVFLYKGSKAGSAKMTFTYGGTVKGEETKFYRFDIDRNASEISENECDPLIKGDCNYDGEMGVADVVSLQRWLIGNGDLKKAENADLNGDGVVDVFDLIAMRRLLVYGSAEQPGMSESPKPILVSKYQNYAWGTQQRITVYDENGVGHTMEYCPYIASDLRPVNSYSKLIEMDNTDNTDWYDELVDIINNDKAELSRMPDELIGKTRSLSDNIGDHSNDKVGEGIGMMNDAGQTTLYLIGVDRSGKPKAQFLFTSGDCLDWIECKELQDYMKELSYNSFLVDGNYIKMLENRAARSF